MSQAGPPSYHVDWPSLPVPADDGAARHLKGTLLPDVELPSTDGTSVSLARLSGRTVVYAYPMTGQPGTSLPDGWDEIPGARGCTPQSCAFRDRAAVITAAGADRIFGLSTQYSGYQREVAERLHLPYPLLSDAGLRLKEAARLPAMVVGGRPLLKRVTLVIDDGRVTQVFYPVFPPVRNAAEVLGWLETNPR